MGETMRKHGKKANLKVRFADALRGRSGRPGTLLAFANGRQSCLWTTPSRMAPAIKH